MLVNRYNMDFHMAVFPPDFDEGIDPTDFDQEKRRKRFGLGYSLSVNGYQWMKVPPGLDEHEIIAR